MTPAQAALDACLRADRGRLRAALVARIGDFQRADDALQEAAAAALTHWATSGPPMRPDSWLLRAALRKAIDALRRDSTARRHAEAMERLSQDEAALAEAEDIPDDRLRLIFTCCHPALDAKSQVALTLRTVCGLTTADIARAFLDAEPTMGQRLSRAKAKIAAAGIPFAIPGPDLWPDRLNAVLTTVYLIFTTGYTSGPQEPRDLCAEAIFLGQLITDLCPNQAEAEGALALMLLTDARRAARTGLDGCSLPLADQDRRLWDRAKADRGRALLDAAMARRRPGPFQIKAAIAACDMADPGPDWPQIALLYAGLHAHEPTPVVQLNHAVALAEAGDLSRALAMLDALCGPLAAYQPFDAACAELLFRAGRYLQADQAYDRAIAAAPSAADAAFLIKRRARLRV